ncbi:MAG: sigma-70 family RNA polymerase sigma factor [Roseburia sp.]|nr:sigma-70 family RNA polymerase sigma factor [Roseburia sp.]
MQTIKYTFADGTTNTVKVSDDIYSVHLEITQQEKRNHWRETRRHTSLYYFVDMGIDFEDKQTESPLDGYIRKETIASMRKAISMLTPKRQQLIYKVFFLGMSYRAIAREQGVAHSSISQQMKTVYKHLRKYLGEVCR